MVSLRYLNTISVYISQTMTRHQFLLADWHLHLENVFLLIMHAMYPISPLGDQLIVMRSIIVIVELGMVVNALSSF